MDTPPATAVLPHPSPTRNTLERALWYIDRLVEAGTPLDTVTGMNVRDLADLYRQVYTPIVQLERDESLRILHETRIEAA